MKSTTLLLVAFSFLGGLSLGLSGPLAKAGDGLLNVFAVRSANNSHADRITASFENQRTVFQAADFRWPLKQASTAGLQCGPKEDVGRASPFGVQHL